MINFLKWFYNNLGNSKGQRFTRLMIIIITIGIISMLIINLGYNDKRGFYWKPADISIKKNISGFSPMQREGN